MAIELSNVLASYFVMLYCFFLKKVFCYSNSTVLFVFFVICYVISNWNNVKMGILFQIEIGIMFKLLC